MRLAGLVRGTAPKASEESRRLRLDDRDLVYTLRRSSRRSFALQVDSRGVRVAVPWPAREAEVEAFVRKHGRWLLDKLAAQAHVTRPAPLVIEDGIRLPVFGEECRLRLEGIGRSARWRGAADGVEELVLPATPNAQDILLRTLRARALPWFRERVAEYCFRLGLPVPPVRLSSARTRWGSCSSRSGIRLHWRLIHLPPALIDYVVAHEVAHLVEMNHSPQFWAVVERLYPDWKAARLQLRDAGRALPVFQGAAAPLLTED